MDVAMGGQRAIQRMETRIEQAVQPRDGRGWWVLPPDRMGQKLHRAASGHGFMCQGMAMTPTAARIRTVAHVTEETRFIGVTPSGQQAFAARKDSGLIADVNRALDELRADGTLKQISDKYFGSDVSGP